MFTLPKNHPFKTQEDLKSMAMEMLDSMKKILVAEGNIRSFVMFYGGPKVLPHLMPLDHVPKSVWEHVVGDVSAKLPWIQMVHVAEAWFVIRNEPVDPNNTPLPRYEKDRMECIMIHLLDRYLGIVGAVQSFERDENGKPIFTKEPIWKAGADMDGSMVRIFSKVGRERSHLDS